jgi:predicted ABC-type ATPase
VSKPLFTIIAGSNGAGKSTLTSLVRDKFQQMPILDPDAISRTLQNIVAKEHSEIEAGKQSS